MALVPAEVEAAVRRGDAPAVRELLRGATEPERASCAKALKHFLKGPQWQMAAPVMLAPGQFMRFLGSGFQDLPAAVAEQQRQQDELNVGYDAWREIANGLAFQLAAFGLAGGVAAAAALAQDFPHSLPYLSARQQVALVLADRCPPWLGEFADRHLRADFTGWTLARMLVRLGVIPPPTVAEYTTGMPAGLKMADQDDHGGMTGPEPEAALLADPSLLEDEVWRLFTVADAGFALEREDRRPSWWDGEAAQSQTWAQALTRLNAARKLDRNRLLDACLGAFSRDFNPNRVSWYATLLGQLQPTVDEIATRSATYLGLLAAGSKPALCVGQDGIGRLLAAGRLDAAELLAASTPALLHRQKSFAIAQLKLIEQAAARQPGCTPDAAAVVAAAFGHERQDIQEAALKLISKLGVPGGMPFETIRQHAADLSPSLAAEATALGLLGPPAAAAPAAAAPDDGLPATAGLASLPEQAAIPDEPAIEARITTLPAATARSLTEALALARSGEVPGPAPVRPEPGGPLPAPVTDPDELVQLLAMLMEDASDAIAAERALAGAVRLSRLPRERRARIAAPLVKRAEQIALPHYHPFYGDLITSDLANLTLAWAGEEVPADDDREDDWHMPGDFAVGGTGQALTMAGIFSARVWAAAGLIETGRGGVLLAEPETERGAITAATLLDRVRTLVAAGVPPDAHDLDVALLRLVPEPAGELWPELARLTGRAAETFRDADQATRRPVSFEAVTGRPAGKPLRGYRDWHDHVLARIVGPVPAAPANSCWRLLTALSDPMTDHEVLYGPTRYHLRHYDAAVAGWPLICPWQPEVAAAHLLRPLSDGLIGGLTPATTAIDCIRHPGHPLGPAGHLALITGLSAESGDTRIAAAQLWAEACADGRLDPDLAARAIVSGVAGGALKASRIADGLQHAAHSALGAYRVVQTVCLATAGLAPDYPAGLHTLLELAARLGTRVGVPAMPAAVQELAARRGSTRLIATARQLAAAGQGPAPDRAEAVQQALAAHLQRAGLR